MRNDLKFQLVFQFPDSLVDDYSVISAMYELFERGLAGDAQAIVDGHDVGMGEFNMFIHTNQPATILQKMLPLVQAHCHGVDFTAGYRSFDEGEYVPLWPSNLQEFSVA